MGKKIKKRIINYGYIKKLYNLRLPIKRIAELTSVSVETVRTATGYKNPTKTYEEIFTKDQSDYIASNYQLMTDSQIATEIGVKLDQVAAYRRKYKLTKRVFEAQEGEHVPRFDYKLYCDAYKMTEELYGQDYAKKNQRLLHFLVANQDNPKAVESAIRRYA